MNTEFFTSAFAEALKNNIPLLVVLCTTILIALYMIMGFLLTIFKKISTHFENVETFEFGKLKIRNKYYKPKTNDDTKNITSILNGLNPSRFLSLLDLIISNKLTTVSQKIVESIMAINSIENVYQRDCDTIFRTTFSAITNDYHEELITYACKVTGFSVDRINRTREYFFISDMITNLKNLWLVKSNEIIERNGFVDILNDRHKADVYINELTECFSQAFNLRQLEVTELKKSEIDDIINDINKNDLNNFYNMFIRLGELKKQMLEKREKRMSAINKCVIESVGELIEDVSSKILDIKKEDLAADTTKIIE